MTDHRIETRAEWQAARDELAKLEAEHAERNAEIKRRRLELPWVPVDTTSSAPAPDARAWWIISPPPRCTSDTAT